MAITDIFKSFKQSYQARQTARMLDGFTPVFTQFGEDIYSSDIVQNCIRCIATEIAKLQPQHVRIDDTGMQSTVNSSINRLLKNGPNKLMTTKDFLEKVIWIRELTNNVFIYPEYTFSGESRIYTGLYPLNPRTVEFVEDLAGKLFVNMTFNNGETYTFAYENLIHIRKDYSLSDLMGGDVNGNSNNQQLLKTLEAINTSIEGVGNALKASLTVRGIIKSNVMLDEKKLKEDTENFIIKLKANQSGFISMDLKNEFIPISLNTQIIDPKVLEILENNILNRWNVSRPIFNGDFTDEQYQAFYEKALEHIIISLGQAFTKGIFTDRELQVGNEIIFYPQKLLFTNTKNKIAVADILGNRGALTDNQLLELFGYPPFEGGNIRHQSLNYIDKDIASQYQVYNNTKQAEIKNNRSIQMFREINDIKTFIRSNKRKPVLAVDFDGTLVERLYPKIGNIKQETFDFVKEKRKEGYIITLWTCREETRLDEAIEFCKENDLEFDYINDNSVENIEMYKGNSRKISADYYLDDKNLRLIDIAT